MADSTLTVRVEGQDTLSNELKTAQSNVIRFVGAVSSAFAALGGIAFPVLESARFQRELLETGKTTDYGKENLLALKSAMVDLSTQINVTAIDLAKISTMGGQMGIGENNVPALASFVEEVARAVTALDMPAEQAVAALGKLINIFNVPASKFRNVISSLNEVSNKSNATAEELFDVSRRIGNLGGAVSMPEAAALSAVMIDLGQTAETAGTTLTKVFADMRSKASEFASFVGGDMTEQKWVDMLQGKGLAALDMYLDRLNQIAPAAAAAAKVDLTGGGRIFEAVTKLQAQRQRATMLEAAALREQASIDANKASMSEAETKRAEDRVKSLKEMAQQANIVTRLTKSANEAYESGDSAMKEQQTVLSGLSAQWVVFENNVRKAAMGLGDALLLPLTNLLRSMSAEMQELDIGSQLGGGVRELIEDLRTVGDYIQMIAGGLSSMSAGLNFGDGLQAAALLAAAGAFKLLSTAASALFGAMLRGSPTLQAFDSYLRGTSDAMRDAATKAEALKAANERTGGVVSRMSAGLSSYADSLDTVTALNARAAQQQTAINNAQQVHAQRLAAVQAQYAGLGKNTQNYASLQAALAASQAKLDAALLSGNTRSAAQNQRWVNTYSAVIAAVDKAQAHADKSERAIERMRASLDATQSATASLSTRAVSMGVAFDTARVAGQGLGASLKTAFAAGGVGIPQWITNLPATFARAQTAVTSFGATASASLKQASSGTAGFMASVNNATAAINRMTTAMYVVGTTATSRALSGLAAMLGGAALSMTGLTDQWNMATTNMARRIVIVNVALTAMTRLIQGAGRLLMRLVGIAFFGMLVKDLLEFLGLWDVFLDGIARVFEFFGGNRDKLPAWMKSSKDIERTAKVTEEYAAALAKQREEAGKFNKAAETMLTLMSNSTSASELLRYDGTDAAKSLGQVAEGYEAVFVAQSRLLMLQDDIAELEKRESSLTVEQIKLRKALAEASNEAQARTATRRLEENVAALNNTNEALAAQKKSYASISTEIQPAVNNLTRAILRQNEAQAILSRSTSTGVSQFEAFANAQAEVLRAETALQVHRAGNTSAFRAPADEGGQAQAAQYRTQTQALEASLAAARAEAQKLRDSLLATVPNNLPLQNLLNDMLTKMQDAEGLSEFGRRAGESYAEGMREGMNASAFTGVAVPQITTDSLEEAGAIYKTSEALRQMYDGMAAVASAKSNQAKQAVTVSQEEIRRAIRQTEAAVMDLDRAWLASTRKQGEYKTGQGEQRRLRERLSEIDARESAELASAERIYGFNADMLRREKLSIEEKYRAIREGEENRVRSAEASRSLANEKKDYDDLVARVRGYKTAIEDSNKVLKQPNLGVKEAEEATKAIENNAIKAKELLTEIDRLRVQMVSREPIGGKLLISDKDVAQMRKDAQELGGEIARAQGAAASSMVAVYDRISGEYSRLSNNQATLMKQAEAVMVSYQKTHNLTMDQVVSKLSAALSTSQEYKRVMEQLEVTINRIREAPETLNPDALVKSMLDAAKAVGKDASLPPVTLNVTADQKVLADSIKNSLKGVVESNPGGGVTIPAKVDAKLAPENPVNLRNEIQDALKEPFDISVRAQRADYRDAVGGRARGGLVDEIPAFATGGKVRGPGTGTSDSILSWLSNGEYVMDALTTRTFGSGFFASLQKLARSGTSSALRSMRLPGFATGGPVGNPFTGDPSTSAAAAFMGAGGTGAEPKRDMVEINLRIGNERVSLFGERQQAGRLVSVLKREEGR